MSKSVKKMKPSESREQMKPPQRKHDLDRVGLFLEMPYLLGDDYDKTRKLQSTIRDLKKPQMYASKKKTRSGVLDHYFDDEFKRLFENEPWKSPHVGFYMRPRRDTDKIDKPVFITGHRTKHHSTPGDYYGTFGPKREAISNRLRPSPEKKEDRPNIYTKATNTRGPGYADITLSKFPEHMTCPYGNMPKKPQVDPNKIPFIPNSSIGKYFQKNPYLTNDFRPTYNDIRKPMFEGVPFKAPVKPTNIGNGFDKWPKHSVEPYVDPHKILKPKTKQTKTQYVNESPFYTTNLKKSFYTTSTISRKLQSAMNYKNWGSYNSTLWNNIKPLQKP